MATRKPAARLQLAVMDESQYNIEKAAELLTQGIVGPAEFRRMVLVAIGSADVEPTLNGCPENVLTVLRGAFAEPSEPLTDVQHEPNSNRIAMAIRAWCEHKPER